MPLEVWIGRDPAHAGSAEHALAERLVAEHCAALDMDVRLAFFADGVHTLASDDGIDRLVRHRLQPVAPSLVLLLRSAWIALGTGCIAELIAALDSAPRLDCVVPLLPVDLPPHASPDYQTLYGLERFSAGLRGQPVLSDEGIAPPDAPLFLIRGAVLAARLREHAPFDVPAAPGVRCGRASRAYAHPLPDYFGQRREDVLPLLPDAIDTLLDIGCGAGGFGALVKQRRGCRVVGLEQSEPVAALARRRLDQVWVGDALRVDPGARFDCVTCLDVIEHVADPDALLARIARHYLRPEGRLVASVPNVGHWSIVLDLLAGRWDYVPAGLLCTTHLRFFTRRSLLQLLDRHGFVPEHIEPVPAPAPAHVRERLAALVESGIQVDSASLDCCTFHVVARLGAPMPIPRPNIP